MYSKLYIESVSSELYHVLNKIYKTTLIKKCIKISSEYLERVPSFILTLMTYDDANRFFIGRFIRQQI